MSITVPAYDPPPLGRQAGPNDNIDTSDARIVSNVVEVGNSLWFAHSVADPSFGGSAIRWYEIDETTNAVLQTGLINDPNIDFYNPSIAVNAAGNVVIGSSGSGNSQAVSAYVFYGTTTAGITTFASPQLVRQGSGNYAILDGFGNNLWGEYSATVVDPSDSSTFWTFQEFASASDRWSVQVSQIQSGTVGARRCAAPRCDLQRRRQPVDLVPSRSRRSRRRRSTADRAIREPESSASRSTRSSSTSTRTRWTRRRLRIPRSTNSSTRKKR